MPPRISLIKCSSDSQLLFIYFQFVFKHRLLALFLPLNCTPTFIMHIICLLFESLKSPLCPE